MHRKKSCSKYSSGNGHCYILTIPNLAHVLIQCKNHGKNEQTEDARGRREGVMEEGGGRRGDEGVVATCLWIGRRRSSRRRHCWAGGAAGGSGCSTEGGAAGLLCRLRGSGGFGRLGAPQRRASSRGGRPSAARTETARRGAGVIGAERREGA